MEFGLIYEHVQVVPRTGQVEGLLLVGPESCTQAMHAANKIFGLDRLCFKSGIAILSMVLSLLDIVTT